MQKYSPQTGAIEMLAVAGAEGLRDECASLFREWVRVRVPTGSRKRVAAMLGASPETVDTWLDGECPRLPGIKHFLAALAAWGPEFAGFVLRPCGDWTKYLSLAGRAERIRHEIEGLRRDMETIGSPLRVVDQVGVAILEVEEAIGKAKET